MAEVILMPRLSDTMTEGVIAAWHKKVGDTVKKGDLLADVETDKATMELESYKDGTLLHLGADKGQTIQVNDLLAIIGEAGEDVSELVKSGGKTGETSGNNSGGSEEKAAPAPEKSSPPETEKQTTSANKSDSGIDLKTVPEVILMPRLSDTMTEGVIGEWHKKVGDSVKKGDLLADIETDKATMELESYKDGTFLYAGAEKGEKIQVNELLCIIGEEGKVDVDKLVAAAKNQPAGAASTSEKEPQAAAKETNADADTEEESTNSADGDSRVKASPLARRLAKEKGINLSELKGSGDNGRITKKDVDNYVPSKKQEKSAAATAVASGAPSGEESYDEVAVSQMRKVIAKRLGESKFTAPHFYLTISIDMDKAVESRAKLNEVSPAKISFNDMVLKACAIGLKQHPKVNSSWRGDKIRVNHHVNIGVAVAVEEGLLVPVVRFADMKSLSQIAGEVKEFAQKAKDKKLQPADWEGSTFTISNLGMFGIDEFTAIINPPDSCILAIGAIQQVPVVKNGQVQPGNVMKVTMSCDHRVVDGASGAAFLQTLKGLLEEPLRMLV